MAVTYGPTFSKMFTEPNVLFVDAGNTSSYPGTGTTWTDLSGRGNNGTLTNGPTFDSNNSGSIVFDGTNDYVDCGNPTSLQSISTLTVESWIYLSASTTGNIVSKYGNNGFRYRINSPNRVVSFLDRGATNILTTTATLALSTWYQVVVTGGSSGLAIYINGSLSTSGGAAYGGGGTLGNLQIGGATDFSNEYFNGRIGVVRVYNRVFTASQINYNFQQLRGRYGI